MATPRSSLSRIAKYSDGEECDAYDEVETDRTGPCRDCGHRGCGSCRAVGDGTARPGLCRRARRRTDRRAARRLSGLCDGADPRAPRAGAGPQYQAETGLYNSEARREGKKEVSTCRPLWTPRT